MKKLLCLAVVAIMAAAWSFATDKRETPQPTQEYQCPYCKVQLRHTLVVVNTRTCNACKGKGWYGYGRTKEACRRNGTLCDPCNYCDGRGRQEVKDYRWVCPRCQRRFR
ncbi:MAG: hypothetical protein ACI4TR_04690 [Bacteroidaceae bacterium]